MAPKKEKVSRGALAKDNSRRISLVTERVQSSSTREGATFSSQKKIIKN